MSGWFDLNVPAGWGWSGQEVPFDPEEMLVVGLVKVAPDGRPVERVDRLQETMVSEAVGRRITLGVLRVDHTMELEVTLTELTI